MYQPLVPNDPHLPVWTQRALQGSWNRPLARSHLPMQHDLAP